MLTTIRKSIPAPAKAFLRTTVVDPLREWSRNGKLASGIERLRDGDRSEKLLKELRAAWGNEGFSADLQYVTESVRLADKCSGPILECGTGLTTLILGVIAERRGIELWCLEQDLEWLEAVQKVLTRNDIPVRLFHTPLVKTGDYAWYDASAISLPTHFDLVVCDGPFVSTDWEPVIHQNWRFGVLPTLRQRDVTFGTLLLDDANEPRAQHTLSQWATDFGVATSIVKSDVGDCAIVIPDVAPDLRLQAR